MVLAIGALLAGALVLAVSLANGGSFFALALGALLIADSVLRLLALPRGE